MSARPSIAEELFKDIIEHKGYASVPERLKAMIDSDPPTFETEHFDVKGGNQIVHGKSIPLTDKEVRIIWSETLAGFSTTGGGVLIWGLDARKKKEDSKIDQVVGLNLVPNVRTHHSLLLKHLHDATDPPVPGVKIESFQDSADSESGFVVCYIPESDYKPHRTEMGGKKWMMRAGDSFIDISPSVLRSLFFPQRRSFITIEASCRTQTSKRSNGHECISAFEFRLFNRGPATAEDPIIQFRDTANIDLSNQRNVGFYRTEKPLRWRYSNVMSVHPGASTHLCHIYIEFQLNLENGKPIPIIHETRFEIEIYTKDQTPQLCILYFSENHIANNKSVVSNSVPFEQTFTEVTLEL